VAYHQRDNGGNEQDINERAHELAEESQDRVRSFSGGQFIGTVL
jgi:hypothetical protein